MHRHSFSLIRRRLLQLGAAALMNPAAKAGSAPIRLALVEGLSGPFANAGEAVFRNLAWAVERINANGGVRLPEGNRALALDRFDSKGQTEEALSALQSAIDAGARFILQGNSSAIASALVETIEKHNARHPDRRVLFLNYSAVDPALTNERCSFWHFRFDAHADMRLSALLAVLQDDPKVQRAYLIGQDYSFGQAVLRESKRQLTARRPDVRIVGEELHPLGRIKDFAPYVTKIMASQADTVVTGNWGNDLTLLVKAARELGYQGRFYTFYGNALGVPAAIGEAGVGRVLSVADWLPNFATPASESFYRAFRRRFPRPQDDYVHMRMQLMLEALVQSIERAGAVEAAPVAFALERAAVQRFGQSGTCALQTTSFSKCWRSASWTGKARRVFPSISKAPATASGCFACSNPARWSFPPAAR